MVSTVLIKARRSAADIAPDSRLPRFTSSNSKLGNMTGTTVRRELSRPARRAIHGIEAAQMIRKGKVLGIASRQPRRSGVGVRRRYSACARL